MKFNRDCKDFSGVYACDTMKFEEYKDCSECKFYQKTGKKILIIKLGAIGDVLRTTPILQAIKEKYENCHITWLVEDYNKAILKNNSNIDKILVHNQENVLRLKFEKFDIMYNFEIDTPATLIANLVKAKKKYGYYFNKDGKTSFYNESAKYYWMRANSDYVNKNNTRTYQEMIFDIAELEWKNQDYSFKIRDTGYADKFKKKLEGKPILGLNIGSSKRWQAKKWSESKIEEFVKKVKKDFNVILLAGPEEKGLEKTLAKKLKVETNKSDNTVEEFFNVINMCDVIVTGDTMAMHVALALNKPTVALFFCTPPDEIEGYERLKKICSPLLNDYLYTDMYSKELSESIKVEDVMNELKNSIR